MIGLFIYCLKMTLYIHIYMFTFEKTDGGDGGGSVLDGSASTCWINCSNKDCFILVLGAVGMHTRFLTTSLSIRAGLFGRFFN